MKETLITTSTAFQLASKNHNFTTEPCVRIYASSPGTVTLQIRGTNVKTPAYAAAYLQKEQLKQLRDLINDYLKED